MDPPPKELMRRWGDLVALPHRLMGREAQLWKVESRHTPMVLRLDPGRFPPTQEVLTDRRWLHHLLDDIATTGFPAPTPIPDEEGRSLVVYDGAAWELLSYIDGVAISWHHDPPLHAIGALLATLHDATQALPPRTQRPSALPLASVPSHLRTASATMTAPALSTRLAGLADRLSELLHTVRHAERTRGVIHGDFTAHNVIASAGSLRPTGVIDFGLAHLETMIADISYGLWRSGRPHQNAHWIDARRAAAWVTGYGSVHPLNEHDTQAIPIYMIGRGLQMTTKRILARRVHDLPLQQVDWLLAHQHDLADTLTRVIERQQPAPQANGLPQRPSPPANDTQHTPQQPLQPKLPPDEPLQPKPG